MTRPRPVPSDPAALAAWDAVPRNPAIDLPPAPEEPSLLTLTVELQEIEPRIWRRLALPGDLTLAALHPVLQAAMGWTDSHLHRFHPADHAWGGPYFVTPFDEEEEGDEGTREADARLDQVLRAPGDQLTYLYDFGDGWEHRLTLESLTALTSSDREPVCLAGAGACPPEDVGGIPGYEAVADWLRGGAPDDDVPAPFEDVEQARSWLPEGFDPDAFDAAETTTAMQVWARGEHLPWHGVPEPLADLVRGLRGGGWVQATTWLNALGPRVPVALDEHDVRRAARPWLAVLDAVGDGVKLSAAGYLPSTVVEEIAQASGVASWWIGKVNREDLTWPVAALRQHTQDVGLLRKAKGRLTPTARARSVAGQPADLVAGVLERLPVGTGFDSHAGWFWLLGVAAGEAGAALDEGVAEMLTDYGWRAQTRAAIGAVEARRGASSTRDALESMAGDHRALDAELVVRLARGCLLGVEASS